MSEAPDADREPGGYLRLPLPVVAIGLFAFLGVLLGVGLYANANWRSPGVIIPTAAPAAAVATAPPATPAPALATPQLATPTPPRAAPTATSPPRSTLAVGTTTALEPALAATPTLGQTALAIAPVTTRAEDATPTANTGATAATPTVSPELADEVGDAYQTYWQVRASALYELDTSQLPEVMSGDHLTAAEDLVSELRSEGRAVQTNVIHNFVVLSASSSDAKVADEYVDNSIYVDTESHAALSQPTGATVREEYEMEKQNGSWRVVSLVRDSS